MKHLPWLGLLLLSYPLGAQKPVEVRIAARTLTQQAIANGNPQVAWLFDDLNTPTRALDWAKKGALDVIAHAPSGSRWALLTTSGSLHQPFTSDKARLIAELKALSSRSEAIDATTAASATGLTMPMHGGGNSDESLQNHSARSLDAIGAAIAFCAHQAQQTSLLLVSNGFSISFPANGTNLANQVRKLNQQAAQSGLIVNAIDPVLFGGSGWQDKEVVLSGLVQATSGRLVDNNNELKHAFADLSLPTPGQRTASQALAHVLAGSKLDQLPMEVVPQQWKPQPGAASGARLVVVISPKGLDFGQEHGRYQQQLRIIGLLENSQGHWVSAREGRITLDLSSQTLQKLQKDGIQSALELPAPPGHYHLVVVGQELRTGKTTSLSANVTLH